MWRSIIIALALTCLALLGWYAVQKYPGRIEDGLKARVQQAIAAESSGITVAASQRDIVLTGAVRDEERRKSIRDRVGGMSGVKKVHDRMTVSVAPVQVSPSEREAVVMIDVEWRGGALKLSGAMPESLIAAAEDKVAAAFPVKGLRVGKKLTETQGVVSPAARGRVLAALEALALGEEGTAKIRAGALSLDVTIRDPAARGDVEAVAKRVGAELLVRVAGAAPDGADAGPSGGDPGADTTASKGDAGPAETGAAATGSLTPAQCRDVIAKMVAGNARITFRPNTGRLTPDGEAKVTAIWQVLERCPDAKGVIEGYHDDLGDPDKIRNLTRRRAFSVHKKLRELGMEPGRFKYDGLGYRNMKYGGKPEARALNQRVEFNITVE